MAHALESINGKTSFVSAREHAWHRLGTVLDSTFTAETALEQANLKGWNVRKEPIFLADGRQLDNRWATVRTNPGTGLTDYLGGTVGAGYTPIQNEDHTELLNALVDESGAHFETAGSLHDGRQVFVTMRMPEHMTIGGIDPVDTYIAALNNHDGRGAFKLLITPVRIVCANTQAAAIREAKSSFSIHHTKNSKQAIVEARQALGLTFQYIEGFQQEAEKMIQQAMTDAQFHAIVEQVTGKVEEHKTTASANSRRKVQDALMDLWADSDTNTEIRGTRWAGYQAFTEYADFYAPIRTKGDKQTARAMRVVTGTADDFKTRAFDLLSV